MEAVKLSAYRTRRVLGRYSPLRSYAGPNMHYRRSDPRPVQANLWLGRVENALKKLTLTTAETAKPAPAPTPAPAKGAKGGKGAKAAAFVSAMLNLFPPPPNSGIRPIYISSMSIGGRKPEHE